jgi:hypothetical protein
LLAWKEEKDICRQRTRTNMTHPNLKRLGRPVFGGKLDDQASII